MHKLIIEFFYIVMIMKRLNYSGAQAGKHFCVIQIIQLFRRTFGSVSWYLVTLGRAHSYRTKHTLIFKYFVVMIWASGLIRRKPDVLVLKVVKKTAEIAGCCSPLLTDQSPNVLHICKGQ